MNFTGSRPTWITNVCALVVACVVVIEMLYVEHARYGVFRPFDALGALVPALVMIIIRNSIFSYGFLFCYVALAIDGFFQAQKYFSGDYIIPGSDRYPAFMLFGVFFGFSILCLAIYAVGALIWFSVRRLRPIVRKVIDAWYINPARGAEEADVESQDDREFAGVIARIAERRKIDRSTAITVTPLFQPMLDSRSLTELRNYLLLRCPNDRGEDQFTKYDRFEISARELKSFNRAFLRKDRLTITFSYGDEWETANRLVAVLLNDKL